MKTKFLICLLVAGLTCPSLCQADRFKAGPYMSGFIGVSIPNDATVNSDFYSTKSSFTDRVEFDPGINLGMTGGYDFGYFRLEGELSYKDNELKAITDQSDNYSFQNVDGNLSVFAMMCNGFFDIHNASVVTPYLGGGIGLASIYLSDTHGTDTRGGMATPTNIYLDDYDTVFAYQVGGGLAITLNQILSLDLGYRYFGTAKARLDNYWDQSVRFKFESHNATVGLRVKF